MNTTNKFRFLKGIVSVLLATPLFAQQTVFVHPDPVQKYHPGSAPHVFLGTASVSQSAHSNTSRSSGATVSMYIDHATANGDQSGYVWRFNSSYGNSDTAMSYAAVSYVNKYIVGFSDFGYTIPARNVLPKAGYVIDSIFVYATHENNSGNKNYITTDVVTIDGATGQPTSTVLWTQTDTTDTTLSSGGNWVGTGAGFYFVYAPALAVSNGQEFGVVVTYNNPKLDTFSLGATYIPDPNTPYNPPTAYPSYIPTSWMKYPPFLTSVIQNASVWYGQGNGYIEAQNWNFFVLVTLTNASTNDDAGMKVINTPKNNDTLGLGDSTMVKVWIHNYASSGNLTSCYAGFVIDGTMPVFVEKATGINVAPGDSTLYTFSKYAALPATGTSHSIAAWTFGPNGELDDNTGNDSTQTITIWDNNVGTASDLHSNGYALYNAYPNPVNKTRVSVPYRLGKPGDATLTFYNAMGQKVKEVHEKKLSLGEHHFAVDISDLSAGIYFYSLKAGDFTGSRQLVILN